MEEITVAKCCLFQQCNERATSFTCERLYTIRACLYISSKPKLVGWNMSLFLWFVDYSIAQHFKARSIDFDSIKWSLFNWNSILHEQQMHLVLHLLSPKSEFVSLMNVYDMKNICLFYCFITWYIWYCWVLRFEVQMLKIDLSVLAFQNKEEINLFRIYWNLTAKFYFFALSLSVLAAITGLIYASVINDFTIPEILWYHRLQAISNKIMIFMVASTHHS